MIVEISSIVVIADFVRPISRYIDTFSFLIADATQLIHIQ